MLTVNHNSWLSFLFFVCSIFAPCPKPTTFTPVDPSDLASALAFALRFQGRKRVHNADEIMAEIVAERLVQPRSALAS